MEAVLDATTIVLNVGDLPVRDTSWLERNAANFVPLSPISFLWRSERAYGGKIAVIDGERRFSYTALADIPAGATIAIQNDPTNGARSLQLLAANGVIKLRDGAGVTAGVPDIVDNPKEFKFVELRAASALAARRGRRGGQQ